MIRKLSIIAALLLATQAYGQRLDLSVNVKCDAVSQVKLLQKAGNEEVRLLAKVSPRFDARTLAPYGIVAGAKAGDIVTLRLPVKNLYAIDNCADILQYCISQPVFPTMNRTRVDTRTDSVQAGLGLPQALSLIHI